MAAILFINNKMWLKNSLLLYENIRIVKLLKNTVLKKYYTENDYIDKCNAINLLYVGYHKERKLGTMVEFICPKHKDKGIQCKDWSHFKTYTYGCSYCTGRLKTNSDIIPLIKNKDVELISEYTGNEKPIKCRCKKCKNIWTTLPKVLITNGSGCPICGKKKAIKAETKTQEQFVFEMKQKNPNIEILGNYVNTHTKIKCKCKIDNTIWYGYPANLLNRSAGCPKCNISNGESRLLNILSKLNINYISQYSIEECKNIYKLRFDAFDIDNNIAFEYNGEQHYYPVDFANKGIIWANNEFNKTKKRDNIKIKYCNDNKIPIIIIPYWEKENMESFLIQKISEIERN